MVVRLREEDIDIISITEISPGITDKEVLLYAKKEKRVVITLDHDFGKLLFHSKVKSFGVILLQIHPHSSAIIYELLKKILFVEVDFTHSFCVVEKHRLRVISLL